jgi:hypothetical protein
LPIPFVPAPAGPGFFSPRAGVWADLPPAQPADPQRPGRSAHALSRPRRSPSASPGRDRGAGQRGTRERLSGRNMSLEFLGSS